MSNQIARSSEQQHLVSRLQQSTLASDAQPSTTGEEQLSSEGSGEARRTFPTHLSQLEVARTGDEAYSWAVTSVPEEGETGPQGAGSYKLQSRAMTRRLSSKSDRMVASKIEQLELSQLKSPQLKELVKRLKHMYSIETPRDEKLSTSRSVSNPYAVMRVGERWQELAGCCGWDGLMDPIDPVLRAEIVRYGEFAQAAYDAFDGDTTSKYCGSCKYEKEHLFERCGLENRGYEITHYLYGTAELDLPNFFTTSSRDDKWSKDSNWVGFVAVCTSQEEISRLGRRDILVAWRGTITKFEWIKDIQDWLAPAGFDSRHGHKDVMVESGFLSVYKSNNEDSRYNKKSAREQVLVAVRDLVEKYKHEKDTKLSISVTGHSLGSALATLCGYDIAESELNRLSGSSPSVPNAWNSRKADWDVTSVKSSSSDPNSGGPSAAPTKKSATAETGSGSGPAGVGSLEKGSGKFFPSDRIPVTVYSFAGPRVGNRQFKNRVEELGVAVLRVANKQDLVTKVPGKVFPKLMEVAQHLVSALPSYKHVGVKLKIDNTASPYLEDPENVLTAHNLEGYLHVVDGFHGKLLPFKPAMRDYALVNKGGDYLKREFFIPASWWQEAYKGLVRDSDGHWALPARGAEIWPRSPATELEKAPEVKKDEQFTDFWRSVSIAYERSTSRSNYVSLGGLHPSASAQEAIMDGAATTALNDTAAVDGAGNGAGDGAVKNSSAVNSAEDGAVNRNALNGAEGGASNRAGTDAVNGVEARQPIGVK